MICKHFTQCGGCSFQDIPYEQQLLDKQQLTVDLLGKYTDLSNIAFIESSPDLYYYRNKMEYSFGRDKETKKIVCGLHRNDQRRAIVDMQECIIFAKDLADLTEVFTEYANDNDLGYYSTFNHKGFLRYLIIRRSFAEKELMINIVVTSQGEMNRETIVERLRSLRLAEKLSSIYLTISDAKSDAAVPEKIELLWGREYLNERVCGLDFKISPFTFFQVNPPALEKFYPAVRKAAAAKQTDKVLDLYCGVGTISSVVAPDCDFLWGIEYTEQSVIDAAGNAKKNGINNISFISGDANKLLQERMHVFKDNIDIIITNPPRSGMTPKAVRRMLEINAPRIVYSSCNVKTLSSDLELITKHYDLVSVKPFDFFPHTKHFEILTVLQRKG